MYVYETQEKYIKEVVRIELLKNYIVYMHENPTNQKKYIGITNTSPKERWNNGLGYKYNTKFYSDIKKYGWDYFRHEILFTGLTYVEAKQTEDELIHKYDTVNMGYNNTYSGLSAQSNFNYFDFKIINEVNIEYTIDNDYFIRVPNRFLREDLSTQYGLNRIFLIVWIIIDRHRTLEDKSYLIIGEILDLCGYRRTRHHPKIVKEIIKCLLFLDINKFIQLDFIDIYNVPYEMAITLKIISTVFDPLDNFTKIYNQEMDSILWSHINEKYITDKETPLRENVLIVYLYIKSFIWEKSENYISYNYPTAFWGSIDGMAKDLKMAKKTILNCIDYLIAPTNDNDSLLIKHETGYIPQEDNKPPKQAPNIYVLNKEGYEKEIQWALNKMMEIYKVDHFIKRNN